MSVRVDATHGGRWTQLSGAGREWLWQRDEPLRAQVVPGDRFVDAGGLEECIPTVRGTPDHGDAWSRAWTAGDPEGSEHVVRCRDFELRRRIDAGGGVVVADYALVARPGYRFIWAGHALLDLSGDAVLEIDGSPRARLFPEAAPYLGRPWPEGAAWVEEQWPEPAGIPLHILGPGDGSATGAVMYQRGETSSTATARVRDGADSLSLRVQCDGQPTGIALWRNLGGFPPEGPYRSIGVEPMLGRVFDLADAAEGDCAVTPASGVVNWRLTIAAHRNENGA
ncbi:hypothetical protein DN069_02450 [Streptacidiphilus pinicola]|uniref:Galactose mutarotase n=1 Tax=Streptacidiphilus pinicola TaxID=2219663 RepID=A0A2X0IPS0_9ACTN|nr:hypothetical protein DN069_02450 [Streptacidiphilus pinicola]